LPLAETSERADLVPTRTERVCEACVKGCLRLPLRHHTDRLFSRQDRPFFSYVHTYTLYAYVLYSLDMMQSGRGIVRPSSLHRQLPRAVSLVGSSALRTLSTEEDGLEKPEPWKSLLEMSARAAWRVAPPRPPEALDIAQRSIHERAKRSRKDLQRTLKKTMESHRELNNRRDRERRRALMNVEYSDKDGKRDSAIHPVLYGPDEVLAAFKFRLFPNYAVTKRVLQETKSLVGSFEPKRVVDFGIGCGSASAAALDVWSDIDWVHGTDSSATMREGSKALLDEYLKETKGSTRLTQSAHLSAADSSSSFDLALFTYTATELPHAISTLAVAALLFEKLSPGGLFVMIEPGTPDGFTSVRTVRNMLLDVAGEECNIIAPCTHHGPCPLEGYIQRPPAKKHNHQLDQVDYDADDEDEEESGEEEDSGDESADDDDDDDDHKQRGFCSFVQTMPGNKGRGKGEKFSYIVVQKKRADEETPAAPGFGNLVELLNKVQNQRGDSELLSKEAIEMETRFLDSDEDEHGLEFVKASRSSFGRIVSAPKKRKGHVLIDCCVGPGQIVRKKISKSMSKTAPGLFAAARKSRWGGLWPNTDGDNEKS
jgi:ribosomal protein RSM22 (predicted rRNA methylase)